MEFKKKFINKNYFYHTFAGIIRKIFNIKSEITYRREKISDDLFVKCRGVIKYGYLKGVYLNANNNWGRQDKASMLLGLYEKEVLDKIVLLSKNKKYFIDIGAADGYYAVGLIKKNYFQRCFCFEMTKNGREIIRENSILNSIEDKISIFGEIKNSLSLFINQKIIDQSFLLIDIEGSEFDLLTDKFLNEIKMCNTIIELHDHLVKNGDKKLKDLIKKLNKYFKLSFFNSQGRNPSQFKELNYLTDNDKWLICSEGRKSTGHWIYLDPLENK